MGGRFFDIHDILWAKIYSMCKFHCTLQGTGKEEEVGISVIKEGFVY